jgi:hypothetical protein
LVRRVYTTGPLANVPMSFGGAALPVLDLPDLVSADLARELELSPSEAENGLEITSLAEFRSNAFAVGLVRTLSPDLRHALAAAARDSAPFVLVPWNLDHPGSVVPALVARTLQLQHPDSPAVRLLIVPFNYAGPAGLIRRLIRMLRETLPNGSAHLQGTFIGRLNRLSALPALRQHARVAWVDGNDPEHDWTCRRLAACGFTPLLLAAARTPPPPGVASVLADEALTVDAETRFGVLSFRTHLPSLRALRDVLPMTRAMAAEAGAAEASPRPKRGRGPTRVG